MLTTPRYVPPRQTPSPGRCAGFRVIAIDAGESRELTLAGTHRVEARCVDVAVDGPRIAADSDGTVVAPGTVVLANNSPARQQVHLCACTGSAACPGRTPRRW